MAFSPSFTCKNTPNVSQFGLTSLTYIASRTCRKNLHLPCGNEVKLEPNFGTSNLRKCISHQRKPRMSTTLAADSDVNHEIHFLSDIVEKFYKCINQDNRKGLEDLISRDCQLEDSAFPYTIKGKKEVMRLLSQLTESMGKNVMFKLGTVCEGNDELTASVNWHLEWEESQIPFSKGCSFFQFSNEGDKLVIRKLQNITESPVKPGILAMALLKIIRSLFDEFPKAAKWFLNSPNIILRAVLSIYSLFIAPFVNPVITFYITLWNIVARTLGYVMSFLHIIGRIFNKNSSSTDISSTEIDKPSTVIANDTSTMETEQEPSSLPEQT
ncbi:uncharacterized protein LOC110719561 [Chenopodium quinoa]|uniref:uncharacterized protein LOC110719561 n=1 Tax=Chenopodium quinoa TaxID=63459 RepID=UPI000B794E5C|nr:uncharacterized protein LOC110719561 [Chenopodium quinoa]